MDYTTENLEKAVTVFYKTETGQQAEAHQWLTDAQNSPQAWSFVWELLDPRRSSEVQFFAATTLHTKLLKYWHEVPKDHYVLLKKRILEAIVTYAMGPKLVLNRLCITLSAYVIQTVPNNWPNAFEELVSSFQPCHLPNVDPERVIWILLEILSVIPEEFQSMIIASSHRARVRGVLQDVTKDILKVAEMCILPLTNEGYNMTNLTTYLNSSKCISAWLQLGGLTIEDSSHIMDLLVDLACYVYWNRLESDCISSEELELVEVVLEALSSVMLQPQTHKFSKYIIRHTSNFFSKFGKILERECQSMDSNKDILGNIYGLIITIADTHAKVLIRHLKSTNVEEQNTTTNVLNCILSCSNSAGMYPVDETSSSLTFGFWYTLQDDILSLDTVECTELLLIVKPYYRQLTCVMLQKSMYPSNWEEGGNSNWSLDDGEMFRCYRQDIADTFMYCYNVLNLEMLDILQNKLLEALNKCNEKPADYWNAVESCLHAYAAISECVDWENLYLPKLMCTLGSIPYGNIHIKVLGTALDTVGAYSEWLMDHPEQLNCIVPLVISGLGNVEVAPSATMALKDVSQNCQKYLQTYAENLLLACRVALDSGQLRLSERIRIMSCIGVILSVLPVERIMECLNSIVGHSIEEMQILVNSPTNMSVTTSLITRLKMLSALFSTLHIKQTEYNQPVQQPILIIVQNTLPLYVQIADKYCMCPEVMLVLCGLLKHSITTLMDDCKILIPSMLQLLINVFVRFPNASVLQLAKTILIMFEKDEDLAGMLHQFLQQLVNNTLQLCGQLNATNQLSEKSDIFEAFFSTLAQLCKRRGLLILVKSLDCVAIFNCAIAVLSIPEMQTLKACTSFLVSFISHSIENGQSDVVQKCGDCLVHRILLNLGVSAPRSASDIFSELLFVLNKKYCDNLSRWLNTQLAQEGFPTNLITFQQKEQFIKLVLREKTNKKKLVDCVSEFSLICRGIIKPDTNIV